MYVIRKTDGPRNRWVSPPGSPKSYTNVLHRARRFDTFEEAEADLCIENECVKTVSEELAR